MDWSFLKKLLPGRKFKEPMAGIYKIKEEELATLKCHRCKADLQGSTIANQGGGPFITCARCKSRYYLRGY